jgi:hypothetical protein
MGMESRSAGRGPNAWSYGKSATSRTEGVGPACSCDRAAIVSRRPTRTFKRWAAPWLLPPDVPRVSMHRAFLGPRDPSRAPTTKDFAEERRPLEVGQSPRLSTQIDLNRAATKSTCWPSASAIRLLTMAHASSVSCGVLVMIAVQSAPASSNAYCRCSRSDASGTYPGRSVNLTSFQRASGRGGLHRRRTDRERPAAIRVLAVPSLAGDTPPDPKESDIATAAATRRCVFHAKLPSPPGSSTSSSNSAIVCSTVR